MSSCHLSFESLAGVYQVYCVVVWTRAEERAIQDVLRKVHFDAYCPLVV